ncbi:MAG: (2Fe-2S)-binding protein [Planctomycetota bacterium]|jgi:aerobic-type carbon monoxide dehydrogenase small subunit (CoxS/CutS family)
MSDDHTSKSNGFSRRRFLQTLGVSAAAAPLARSADAQQRERTGADGVAILGPGPVNISLRINGKPYAATIDPATTLLDALRIELDLTGTKEICDRGACGGCSVLVDGKLTASCMTLAVDAIGSEITTVEGLAEGDRLDPVQESFVRHDALQCGYCTPGMIMAVKALLNENPRPTPREIKQGLSGNLCRCGTYTNVVNAVLDASGQAPIRDGGGG